MEWIEETVQDETMDLIDEGYLLEARELIEPFRDSQYSHVYDNLDAYYRARLSTGDGYSMEAPLWLEIGERGFIYFSGDQYFVVAPKASGNYTFRSALQSGSGDLDAYLYDEQGSLMTYDHNVGDFHFSAYLEEGEIYYLRVANYSYKYVSAYIFVD